MLINSNNIVQEFRKETFEAIVTNYPLGELFYRNYFNPEFRDDFTFASAEIDFGAKIAADIVAIGSRAPRKGREFAQTYMGEIPKVEIARDMTEKDLIDIQKLRAAVGRYQDNTELGTQLINKIYEDPQFCIDGVNTRMEWISKQLASTGKFVTKATNNDGGVLNLTVDFKVKTSNLGANIFAANPDFETFDPIQKFKDIQKEARAKGYPYSFMIMDQIVFDQLVKFKKVMLFAANFNQALTQNYQTPSLEQLNAQLRSQRLPEIVIWESYFQFENKKGERTMESGWEKGNIMFTQSLDLGRTQYTLTTEFQTQFPDVMTQQVNSGFILVKSFGSQDPIMLSTKAITFAMPVLNNIKKKEIIKCTA